MPCLQRAVIMRAAAAALTLGVALGAEAAVGHALAKRGVERAERDAYVCSEVARVASVVRADRSQGGGRPALIGVVPHGRCADAGR